MINKIHYVGNLPASIGAVSPSILEGYNESGGNVKGDTLPDGQTRCWDSALAQRWGAGVPMGAGNKRGRGVG